MKYNANERFPPSLRHLFTPFDDHGGKPPNPQTSLRSNFLFSHLPICPSTHFLYQSALHQYPHRILSFSIHTMETYNPITPYKPLTLSPLHSHPLTQITLTLPPSHPKTQKEKKRKERKKKNNPLTVGATRIADIFAFSLSLYLFRANSYPILSYPILLSGAFTRFFPPSVDSLVFGFPIRVFRSCNLVL